MTARPTTFASLRVRNYRLFATGGLISNTGSWMAIVAQDWLVLMVLTDGSSTSLGFVASLQFLPIAVFAPVAGAYVDRVNKRKLLMITQSVAALNGLLLCVLVATGHAALWQVYVLATVAGITMAFDNPARQAFVAEMVPPSLLPNAIGLNSASFNSARLLGPAVAGLLIGAFGIAPALAINSFSYLAVILALWRMAPSELTPAPRARGKGAVRAGLRYVRRRPEIMLVLFVVFMLGTFGMNFQLTNALMATKVFGQGAEAYGLLGSIMAVGSLSAALIAARRTRPRLRVLLGALAAFTGCTMLLGFATSYWMYAVLLVPVGLAALTVMTTANSMVQLAVEPEYRGRVMALYMAIFLGGTPVGAPIIGWIGDAWGPRWTLWIGAGATGVACVIAAWYLIVHQRLRVGLRSSWPPRLIVEPRSIA